MTVVAWEPLAPHNPLPGDPFEIQALARHLAERGGSIRDVIAGLRRVEAGDQQNEAVRVLVERRDEILPDLDLLACRYERASGALRRYCPALEEAQRLGEDALRRARAADEHADRARRGMEETAQAGADAAAAGVPVVIGPDWPAELDDAEAHLRAARRLLGEAVELRDQAAATCVGDIDDAVHDELRNDDSFWGAIGDTVGGAVGWIADHWPSLKDLSQYAGYLAAGLGLLSLVFPPLGVAAAAVGAVKLVIDTYLAATGQGSWGEVAWGTIGLATFGTARVFTAAARGTAGAAAVERLRDLESSLEGVGSLRGLSSVTDEGVTLWGAAMRSRGLRVLPEAIGEFGTEAATVLPRSRHLIEAATRWRSFEAPGREILNLSRAAVRFRNIAWGFEAAGAAIDIDEFSGEHTKRALFGEGR